MKEELSKSEMLEYIRYRFCKDRNIFIVSIMILIFAYYLGWVRLFSINPDIVYVFVSWVICVLCIRFAMGVQRVRQQRYILRNATRGILRGDLENGGIIIYSFKDKKDGNARINIPVVKKDFIRYIKRNCDD